MTRCWQFQGVAYLHPWSEGRGGGFFFNPTTDPAAPMRTIEAVQNTGILLDGSKMVHGSLPWRAGPGDEPPPALRKDVVYRVSRTLQHGRPSKKRVLRTTVHPALQLLHVGNDTWALRDPDQEQPLREYRTEDLRISLVWRARCFTSEADKQHFHEAHQEGRFLNVSDALSPLRADLVRRTRTVVEVVTDRPFVERLIDEYVTYPGRGVNYCLATELLPKPLSAIALSILNVLGSCR
jgi:hypothetical protein